jgi:hypothetical protein
VFFFAWIDFKNGLVISRLRARKILLQIFVRKNSLRGIAPQRTHSEHQGVSLADGCILTARGFEDDGTKIFKQYEEVQHAIDSSLASLARQN